MGYASYLINKSLSSPLSSSATKSTASLALGLYWIQLAGNLLWTPLFFGFKKVRVLCCLLFSWRGRGEALGSAGSGRVRKVKAN